MTTEGSAATETPRITELPSQKVAVVYTGGDPRMVAERALPTLYESVEALKAELAQQGREMQVGRLRVRWPDFSLLPMEQWTGIWGLPVPEDTVKVPQTNSWLPVVVETWHYGTMAEVLYVGENALESPALEELRHFLVAQGYQVTGSYEEEHLTLPMAEVQQTVIRYPVKKR